MNKVQVLKVNNLWNEFENRQLLRDIQSLIEQGHSHWVLDLSTIHFLNSVGLNFLLTMRTRTSDSKGDFIVAGPSDQVIKLLDLTRLKSYFRLSPDVAQAIDAMEAVAA